MLLSALTDAEFLRHAQAEHDPLIASAMETELLRRFADLLTRTEAEECLLSVLREHEISESAELANRLDQPDQWDLKPIATLTEKLAELGIQNLHALEMASRLADVAMEHDIGDPQVLQKLLERQRRFEALLCDLTDPVNTITQLAKEAA